MKIKCNICGKEVSTSVPEGTVIMASIECPECLEKIHKKKTQKKLIKAEETIRRIHLEYPKKIEEKSIPTIFNTIDSSFFSLGKSIARFFRI